jgi:hypothetical protein
MRFLLLLLVIPFLSYSQCVKIQEIKSSVEIKELGNKDVKFGVKQMAEDMFSSKFCLSDSGEKVFIDIFYFGLPKKSLRIVGIEESVQTTEIGIQVKYKGKKYEEYGESESEMHAVMLELTDGIPFSKMTVSNSIKKALEKIIKKISY